MIKKTEFLAVLHEIDCDSSLFNSPFTKQKY